MYLNIDIAFRIENKCKRSWIVSIIAGQAAELDIKIYQPLFRYQCKMTIDYLNIRGS